MKDSEQDNFLRKKTLNSMVRQNRHIGETHHAELVAHDADGGVVGELEIVDARHHRREVLVGVHVRRVEGLQR